MTMSMFSKASITGAGNDLMDYLKIRRQHNWLLWILACMPPAILLVTLHMDYQRKIVPLPETPFYIQSWPADRSIEETVANQIALQKRKDAKALEQREIYKAIGRMSGMDVDEIEREIEAERKAAKAKAEAEVGLTKGQPAAGASQ